MRNGSNGDDDAETGDGEDGSHDKDTESGTDGEDEENSMDYVIRPVTELETHEIASGFDQLQMGVAYGTKLDISYDSTTTGTKIGRASCRERVSSPV